MLYGSETWALKKEDEQRLEHNEMRIVRRMCNVILRNRSSEELRGRLGIEGNCEVMHRGRLRWLEHVERMDNCVRCMNVSVDRRRPRGHPRKT